MSLSPGDEFEWSVDGATLTLVMPAGAKHGQEHEFSFVADDGGTRFFKATIPSVKAPPQATGEKRYAFHQESATPAAPAVASAESIVLTGPLTGPPVYISGVVEGGLAAAASIQLNSQVVSINNARVGGHAQGTALLQQAEGELIITCVHAETVWSEVTQTWIQAATEAKKHTLVKNSKEDKLGLSMAGGACVKVESVESDGVANGVIQPGDLIAAVDAKMITAAEWKNLNETYFSSTTNQWESKFLGEGFVGDISLSVVRGDAVRLPPRKSRTRAPVTRAPARHGSSSRRRSTSPTKVRRSA